MARPQAADNGARAAPPPAEANSPATAMVDVTLSRETATFSVPVSEAATPASLTAAISKVRDHASGEKPAAETVAQLSLADDTDDADFDDLDDHRPGEEILTLADIALIGRMAPPAAE